jgi:DNA-binding transcriptional MerR regulator
MLTIGQLAAYVGVTVRAVRHYHQRGLLAEPARDASGYRRYGAQAVLDLIRIKTLAEAGVPLARVEEVLSAPPERFAEAIARIDEALREEVRELERRRRRIADLAGGERLFLPPEFADFLDELRGAGVSPRTVQAERDGWVLLLAAYPEQAHEMLREKRASLADPAFRRLYRGFDKAFDWDPADPRLEELAEALVQFATEQSVGEAELSAGGGIDDPTAHGLLAAHFTDVSSPAQERLNELCAEKLAAATSAEDSGDAPTSGVA